MKIRIAVRVKNELRRRLYSVEDHGMSVEEMRAAVAKQLPKASVILIEVPRNPRELVAA